MIFTYFYEFTGVIMVVVENSTHNRIHRNDYDQDDDKSQQLLLDEDAAIDFAIANFCPRLRDAISALSRHKVGELSYNFI